MPRKETLADKAYLDFLTEFKSRIAGARLSAARAVNRELDRDQRSEGPFEPEYAGKMDFSLNKRSAVRATSPRSASSGANRHHCR